MTQYLSQTRGNRIRVLPVGVVSGMGYSMARGVEFSGKGFELLITFAIEKVKRKITRGERGT